MTFPSRVLVTGSGGFVGGRAMAMWPNAVAWPQIDLLDRPAVETTVATLCGEASFDGVLHLAALSSIQDSFHDPTATLQVNVLGTSHLLEALRLENWKGRFLYISSGAVYGDPATLEMPVTEESALLPASPYAASKAAAEQVVLEWGRRGEGQALVARPVNHAGPGQTDHYFLPSMARQITRVARGQAVAVETGNLEVYRDFLHVDDVIDAYQAILTRGRAGSVYNVASGQSSTLGEMLSSLVASSGRNVESTVSASRYREERSQPLEVSIARLQNDTDWAPKRGLPLLYDDLIHFWENMV